MDPISEMIATIKNGLRIQKSEVVVPYSKLKEEIAKILVSENFLSEFKKISSKGGKKNKKEFLLLKLKYSNNLPAITEIRRVSKPGRRFYVNKKFLPKLTRGFGRVILSTSKGVMTDIKAKKMGIGGEVILKVW